MQNIKEEEEEEKLINKYLWVIIINSHYLNFEWIHTLLNKLKEIISKRRRKSYTYPLIINTNLH